MIIGLTGGIGSGKSMVAKVFETMGCALFNSDIAAKEIYFDREVKAAVINLLGEMAYNNNTINKEYISSRIFSDTSILHQLNNIIHPAVKEEFKKFALKNREKVIVKETALLFEAGLEKDVDSIVTVVADDEVRIARVMKRDGLSREEVLKKMKSQLSQDEKIKRSHFVIHNNDNDMIIPQVIKVMDQLKK